MNQPLTRASLLGSLTKVAEIAVGERVSRISIAGNRFTLIDDAGNETPWNYLQLPIVALAFNPTPYRRMFLKLFDPNAADVAPDCQSNNGVAPDPGVAAPQSASCASCPMNAFGTALNGKGKRCAEYARLAVAVVGDDNKRAYQLNIPPASRVALKAYADGLARQMKYGRGTTMGDVITLLGFESQGVLNFTAHAWVDAAPDLLPLLDAIVGAQDIEALIGLKNQNALPAPPVQPQLPQGQPQWNAPSPAPSPVAPPAMQPAPLPPMAGLSAMPPAAPGPASSGEQKPRGRGRPPKAQAPVPGPVPGGMGGQTMASPSTPNLPSPGLPPMMGQSPVAAPTANPSISSMPSGLSASPPADSPQSSYGMATAPAAPDDIAAKLAAAMGIQTGSA